ncbi:hypothetical protein TPY_2709 [Sulfobacillus acidophilus TPY]|nr:hypothetical protein TPY_2709 [Sulfobacillus acidophilus TPY]
MSVTYDPSADVLYLGFGPNPPPPSYSIGNPAQDADVEWMVAVDDPDRLTGAIVMNWHRRWVAHQEIPPLPGPVLWADVANVISLP